jgi:hypothetical protein
LAKPILISLFLCISVPLSVSALIWVNHRGVLLLLVQGDRSTSGSVDPFDNEMIKNKFLASLVAQDLRLLLAVVRILYVSC